MQYGAYSTPVRVSVNGEPNAVTVMVGNDGVPIPPDKIRTIFDPLKRVATGNDVAPAGGNLGLGLYITKEVVVAHNGTIEVTSSEMEGTTFTARFPRLQPDPALHEARRHG